MPDYTKGKIYTIRSRTDPSLIYVGSTIETLSLRLARHRASSKTERCKNVILYQNVNGDWDDYYIELYENYPCNSKEELNKREGEIIRQIGTLNKKIEGRKNKEYYEDNKDKILEHNKEYKDNNKDKIKEQRKKYNEENKEKIKEKDKEYYKDNIEKFQKQHKEYYEKNKDKLLEKIACECGGCFKLTHKSTHLKTKKHLSLLAINSQ